MSNLRRETRDRLACSCDCPPPPPPIPAPSITLAAFKELFYKYAESLGYTYTKEEFEKTFINNITSGGSSGGNIIVRTSKDNFPATGDLQKLYYSVEEKELYIWDNGYFLLNVIKPGTTILECGDAFSE